jgi:hypothetical protein
MALGKYTPTPSGSVASGRSMRSMRDVYFNVKDKSVLGVTWLCPDGQL